MRIGVPREIKVHEYRVGLVPAGVRELVGAGHEVIVETGAGNGIGVDDAQYRAAGFVRLVPPVRIAVGDQRANVTGGFAKEGRVDCRIGALTIDRDSHSDCVNSRWRRRENGYISVGLGGTRNDSSVLWGNLPKRKPVCQVPSCVVIRPTFSASAFRSHLARKSPARHSKLWPSASRSAIKPLRNPMLMNFRTSFSAGDIFATFKRDLYT